LPHHYRNGKSIARRRGPTLPLAMADLFDVEPATFRRLEMLLIPLVMLSIGARL